MAVDATRLVEALKERTRLQAQEAADLFADRVRQGAPRATGELVDSVEVGGVDDSGSSFRCSITVTAEHARYRDEGTGIYGPDGTRIYPTSSRVLVFDWAAAGGIVFATSVAGSPGTHYWENAVNDWPNIAREVAG